MPPKEAAKTPEEEKEIAVQEWNRRCSHPRHQAMSKCHFPADFAEGEREKVNEMLAQFGFPAPSDTPASHALDCDLLRFLRARKGNVQDGAEQWRKSQVWRAENNVTTMFDQPDPYEDAFQCICPHMHLGHDKEGHPVYFEGTGSVRVPMLLKHMAEDDMVNRHVYFFEYVLQRMAVYSKRFGKNIDKHVIIMDLANLSYKPDAAGMRVFRRTLQIDQHHYPERLHKMFLINAPITFRGVWAMVKPWVDPNTTNKIVILGGNYKEKLLEVIDADQLLRQYGGTVDVGLNPVMTYPPPAGQSAPPKWPDLDFTVVETDADEIPKGAPKGHDPDLVQGETIEAPLSGAEAIADTPVSPPPEEAPVDPEDL